MLKRKSTHAFSQQVQIRSQSEYCSSTHCLSINYFAFVQMDAHGLYLLLSDPGWISIHLTTDRRGIICAGSARCPCDPFSNQLGTKRTTVLPMLSRRLPPVQWQNLAQSREQWKHQQQTRGNSGKMRRFGNKWAMCGQRQKLRDNLMIEIFTILIGSFREVEQVKHTGFGMYSNGNQI